MSKQHCTALPPSGKPAKPYPEFPLFAHANGQWSKKIRGRHQHFGVWADPDGALRRYLDQKDALHAGEPPTPADTSSGLTVLILCGRFLTSKKRLVECGELSIHSYRDYEATCKLLVKSFGKSKPVAHLRPDDFERLRAKFTKRWGPVRLGNEVNRVRSVFKYAPANGLIDKPVVFGEMFKRPSKKTLKLHRKAQGPKMFSAEEIRRMLDAAGQPLKAMILLGVNAGYGNNDVGTLPLEALDLDGASVAYHRPKTGVDRCCPLWPQTVAALREWLTVRPAPKKEEHAGLVFVTARGGSWAKVATDSPVSKEFRKLLNRIGVTGHRNYYCLRHVFQTIGDQARDFIATRMIMGHSMDEDIASAYREEVSDDRLRAVADHVRGWLFGPATKAKRSKAAKRKSALRIYSA
jgi:integrase